jgi:RNA polymerase sigma-70 factor, ECF subfamily
VQDIADGFDWASAAIGAAVHPAPPWSPVGIEAPGPKGGALGPQGDPPAPAERVACHDAMGYHVGSVMTVSIPDEELEALRRHGFGVAYRMLGSVAESEDVGQEALPHLTRQEGPIDKPAAWMTTVTTRLSINVLRSARARRESYVGPWLPEPLLEDPAPGPASRAELADSLSLALLVLLEQLNPVERAAYLLRDVFGYEYAQIADIIERTEVNSRQLVTRARRHLDANRPRFDADEAARDALLERFLAAAEDGEVEALEQLLAKDAVLYADSGGKAMAPREPLVGAAIIARFMAAVAQAPPAAGEFETRRVRVNGQPGRVLRGPAERPLGQAERLEAEKALALLSSGEVEAEQLAELVKRGRDARSRTTRADPDQQAAGHVWSVLTVDVVDGRIQAVRIVRNPDKLSPL